MPLSYFLSLDQLYSKAEKLVKILRDSTKWDYEGNTWSDDKFVKHKISMEEMRKELNDIIKQVAKIKHQEGKNANM